MNTDDLLRRLRGSNPYPANAELPATGDDLRDVVAARVRSGDTPVTRGRGLLLAAAAAVAVIVVGVGALVFLGGDDSPPVATEVTTTTTGPPPTTTPPTTEPPTTDPTTTTFVSSLPSCTETEPEFSSGDALVFFATCGGGIGPPYPVYRATDDDRDELALLIGGTTAREQARELSTGWDAVPAEEREKLAVTVERDPDDVVTLEFTIDGEEWNPGQLASASAQLLSFLEPLQATVFATDPSVAAIDLSNLCWGEMGCGPPGSNVSTRADWEGGLFVTYGVLHFPGCDLETYRFVDGCSATDAPTEYDGTVVNVAPDDTLNVRSGPGIEYFRVAELEPGARAFALSFRATAADGGLWQGVRLVDGTNGWVNSAFIAPTAQLGERTSDEQLIDAFVEFAKDPQDATFAGLPLTSTVELGLSRTIYVSRTPTDLRNRAAWTIDVGDFAGYVGPFSILDQLARLGLYEVTLGPHDHCASPPREAPEGFEDFTRISVQPVLGPQSSCLQWSTVDLFVNEAGLVEAITLDLWEP